MEALIHFLEINKIAEEINEQIHEECNFKPNLENLLKN